MLTVGANITISCTAIGIPVPTISWTSAGQRVSFAQTDQLSDYNIVEFEDRAVTPGSVVSTLQIVNALSTDTGMYVCTGSNTHGGITTSSSATVAVTVLEMGMCMYRWVGSFNIEQIIHLEIVCWQWTRNRTMCS